MSDRTQGSVRTGTRKDQAAKAVPPDAEAAKGARPEQPVQATQSIPTGSQPAAAPPTGAQKAQPSGAKSGTSQPGGAQPAGAQPPAAQPPAAPPTGSQPSVGARTTAAAQELARVAAAAGRAKVAAGRKGTAKAGGRGPRRARLQLRHIDTWSAFKISLVLSIALFFIWLVAVGVLYGVLSGLGVFDTLNDLFGQLSTASGGEGGGELITPGIVFGAAAVIGAINIVLLTALGTVATFIYNLCSDLVGGLEVTLSERD